jgi:hypothetical protein
VEITDVITKIRIFFKKPVSPKIKAMNKEEIVAFLQKYGCEDITVFHNNIHFKVFKRPYTIIANHKIYKTLVIGDLRKHHNLPIYPFVYMEYDNCYPMPYMGNDKILFTNTQCFCEIREKYHAESTGSFMLRIKPFEACD